MPVSCTRSSHLGLRHYIVYFVRHNGPSQTLLAFHSCILKRDLFPSTCCKMQMNESVVVSIEHSADVNSEL